MLCYGPPAFAAHPLNDVIYNLFSFNEKYPRLSALMPPPEIGVSREYEFDVRYANYIISNDIAFKEFFDIIYCLYIGKNVYLTVSDGIEWCENVAESLLKLIQQRYGYNGFHIGSFEDYDYILSSDIIGKFNPIYGLHNLNADRERYTMLIESNRVRSGGPLILPDE